MHPLAKLFLLFFALLTLWMLYEAFMVFVWPRLKPWVDKYRDDLKTLKAYDIIEQERKAKIVKANEPKEVEVEDLKEERPVIWDIVSNGKRKSRHVVLNITPELTIVNESPKR